MNFVYISPHFPAVMQNFCIALRENGVTVLGIGDAPYETLSDSLRGALQEYYRVNDMENYDQMLRAVAYFTFKYGKIDYLESNNEYWLEQDARLRTDFNITTGLKSADMAVYKCKSRMKEIYAKAGIPAARWQLATTAEAASAFVQEVGYPIIVKPNSGVGACGTWKLNNNADLSAFFAKPLDTEYIMEEFVSGEVTTFDGVCGSQGEVLLAASHVSPGSIMEMVNEGNDCFYYVSKSVPADVAAAGRSVLAALGAKKRCFHLEFFRLSQAKESMGRKGDLVALEINMRPAGGFTPDMIDYAYSTSLYQIYADMVTFGELRHSYTGPHAYCAYFGRRDHRQYLHSHDEIMTLYGAHMHMVGRMPDALSAAMGNQVYIACFDTKRALFGAADYVLRTALHPASDSVSSHAPVPSAAQGKPAKPRERRKSAQ